MTSRPDLSQGSFRLDHSVNLEGRGFRGKFEPHFDGRGKAGQKGKKLGLLSMRQKLSSKLQKPYRKVCIQLILLRIKNKRNSLEAELSGLTSPHISCRLKIC